MKKSNAAPLTTEQQRQQKHKRGLTALVAAFLVVIILLSALGIVAGIFGDEHYPFDLDEYLASANLVWQDEFDGNALDTTKWNAEGAGHTSSEGAGFLPRRGGYWTPEAVSVEDGNLLIKTYKNDDKFYTGAVTSVNKYNSRYGYYEVRCILPKAYGIWSAFWMMPVGSAFSDGNADAAVAGAEIDILEAPVYPNETVQQAVHVGGYESNHRSIPNLKWLWSTYGDLYDSFHTYGVYWNEEIYIFTLDRKVVWTTSFSNNVSQIDEYLFLSVEVGGSVIDEVPVVGNAWGNAMYARPDDNRNDWSKSADFVIDYVRHYQ